MVRSWWVAAVVVVVLVVAGCGDGGSGGDGDAAGGGSAGGVSATLGIITTNIDTDTGEGFSDAVEGEELVVGDRVRTDDTGFAEVTYHDGSWMRVESAATLTIEDLVDGDGGQVVSTSIDTGEAWSRVRELSEPEDGFVVDTPVASAAVRGTAFAIGCEGDASCTFRVVEGEVLVTPDTGEPVTLTAGQSLTVTADEEPPAPTEPGVDELSTEPFIAENLELDEAKTAETDQGGDDQSGPGEQGALGLEDLEGVWTATPSDARLDETIGYYTQLTPQVSVSGDRAVASWAGVGPDGVPRSGSSDLPLTAGTYDLGCTEQSCMGFGQGGFPLLIVGEGPGLRVAALDGGPREGVCGLAPPAGAWEVERVDDDTLRYTDVVGSGSGGDGCQNAFSILYEVTLTRAGGAGGVSES